VNFPYFSNSIPKSLQANVVKVPYCQPQTSCPVSLHTCHNHPFIKTMKPTVISIKHNLYFSGIWCSCMYMFWLSVGPHQAVYYFSVCSTRDESLWDHHLNSHNLSRRHCILKWLMNTVSVNRWYILQDKDKMPEETCAYKCWLLSTWYHLFSSFLEKSSVYYPLCADMFFFKKYRS